jgi:hypothetical protein
MLDFLDHVGRWVFDIAKHPANPNGSTPNKHVRWKFLILIFQAIPTSALQLSFSFCILSKQPNSVALIPQANYTN